MAMIQVSNLKKTYGSGEIRVQALNDVSFEINQGELTIIVGASGAGKTTVLNLIGGMDSATDGKIVVDGREISSFTPRQLTEYRRHDIGFVFQFYNLVSNLTAIENVELATQICKDALDPEQTLVQVGLENRIHNFPSQLSGGEQQRVAIARAIAKNPKLLLCDEPTGALDYNTGRRILELLQQACREWGMTVVIITHNGALAPIADRVLKFRNGQVEQTILNENPVPVQQIEW